jgi:hypothetical protein
MSSLGEDLAQERFAEEAEAIGDAQPDSSNSLCKDGLSSERVDASCLLPLLPRGAIPSPGDNDVEKQFAKEEVSTDYTRLFLDRIYSNVGLPQKFAEQTHDFLETSADDTTSVAWLSSLDDMLESIVAAEFYSSNYASKDQPHAQGLLHTLHDSMERAKKFKDSSHEDQDIKERARKLLQQLVAATNRRMHKGFPSIYAYLLQRPNHYASHTFVSFSFGEQFGCLQRVVLNRFAKAVSVDDKANEQQNEDGTALQDYLRVGADGKETERQGAVRQQTGRGQTGTHTAHDYDWRPAWMENFPLYLYIARSLIFKEVPHAICRTA